MSDNYNNTGANISAAILGTAFVVLKLCHVIDWSWWWVTAPFWGPFAIALIFLLICAVVAFIKSRLKK